MKARIMSDWYIYLIKCSDGSLYTGISTDVGRRFAQHQKAGYAGSKYLKGRGPLTIVLQSRVGCKSTALKVERMIKRLSHPAKVKLITSPEDIEEMIKRANE
jgi:putative endonuclease